MKSHWAAMTLVLIVLVVAARPGHASAHAALVASEPAQNAFLQRAPGEITLRFSEPLETKSSGLRLLDAHGTPLSLPAPDYTDSRTLRVVLPGLKPGIYNVLWFNVSHIDGHGLQGSFPFTVLNADGSVPDVTNAVTGGASDPDQAPAAEGVAVRALSLLGLVIIAGVAIVSLLWVRDDPFPGRAFTNVALIGAVVLAEATLLNLEVLRTQFSDVSLQDVVFQTRVGGYWLTRLGAVFLLAVVSTMLTEAPRRAAAGLVVAATLYLFAFTATSHAAAGAGGAWAGTLDLLHGVAATLWIGAVTGLALTARLLGSRPRYAQLMARFSLMASALVFVLLATGALGAFVEVATPGQLTDTWYGKTLLVKLGLLVPLLAVAGYNARWGKRRLIRAARGEPRRFVATVTLEAALGLGVMLAAAFLTQTGVAKSVVRASEVKPFLRTGQAADLRMELSIDPNRTGLNTFRVRLQDAAGAPVEAQRTQLVFRYQEDQTVGPATLNLQKTGDGVYLGQGPFLPLEGQWRVEVSVRRADVDDANAFFDVRPAGTPLAGGSANGRWDNPAPGLSWNSFGGFAVLLFGLALALWREQLGRFGRAAALGANTGVLLGFGIGALLLFGVHSDAATSTLPRNPIVADQNSVAAGKKIYEQNCVTCHGLQGVPPRGLNLNPYPLDLTVHVPQHPDGQIYQFIANGFPGTAMKSWSRGDGKLSNDQIWHLVNFLRTLKEADQ